MFKKQKETHGEFSDKTIKENQNLREILKKTLEESVMAINEIQDIQAIKISEEDKDKMRNSIINSLRTKFVTKIIELDSLKKHSNS